jgi:hypothetical protein
MAVPFFSIKQLKKGKFLLELEDLKAEEHHCENLKSTDISDKPSRLWKTYFLLP